MTTTAEKIKVMQAFEAGEKVQSRLLPNGDFLNYFEKGRCTPTWNWETREYRIKPKRNET